MTIRSALPLTALAAGLMTVTTACPGAGAVSSAVLRGTAAAQAPVATDTGSLFEGATYASGARERPSTGGVALATRAAGPLQGTTIVLDPGHNGGSAPAIDNRQVPDGRGGTKACNTTGTATTGGYTEHAHNWAVVTKAAARLQQLGAAVVLTRPDDAGAGPCVNERAVIGNAARADLVISVHADGAPGTARGFHVIRSTGMAGGSRAESESARAATVLRDAYAAATGLPRSSYVGEGTGITPRPDIAGLNLSLPPAVMLEAGNMRNPAEAALLTDPAFQEKESAAVVSAARTFLGR